MLTIEIRGIDSMTWATKSALLMLALMVVWTAMPASACLLAAPTAGQQACCRNMALDCPSDGMAANGSCCQVSRENPAVTPGPLSAFEYPQRFAPVPTQATLQVPASQGAACHNVLEALPPDCSPGGISILRI
jgi:hypothetical protein